MSEEIRIGRSTFDKEILSKLSLSEAIEKYYFLDSQIVKQAHKIACPKGKKSSKPKDKKPTKKAETDDKND